MNLRPVTRMALLVAVFAASSGVLAAPQEFTFRFDIPGDRQQFIQESVTQRTRDMGEHGRVVDSSESTVRITVERRPGGFVLTAEPLSVRMLRDGKEVSDPLLVRLQHLSFRYVLDGQGVLQRIEGIGEALDEVFAGLPEALAATLRQQLNEPALVARETAEWNGRIGDFIGLTVSVGDVLESVAPFRLPNGETLEFVNSYAFPRTVACGESTCVEVVHTYTSDAEAVARFAGEVVEQVSEAAGAKVKATGSTGSIRGSARRLIEPSSMRVHEERLERTIVMVMELSGQGPVRVSTTETREYRFDYR